MSMSLPCTPSNELEKISVSQRPQNLEAIFRSYLLKIYTKKEHFKRREAFFFKLLIQLDGKNF